MPPLKPPTSGASTSAAGSGKFMDPSGVSDISKGHYRQLTGPWGGLGARDDDHPY